MSKLRDIATRGIAWNAFERFSGQFINLIVGVILARILTPEDFGLLGMLLLFTSVANLFVDSGMGSGLIQQQEKKSIDFSTVFIFNLVVSFLFYFLLFALAPHISAFYEEIRLTALLRILSLNIIIGALTTIQRVKLNISLDFKTLAQINIISTLLSGIIGIYFATVGLGYWSLVLQSISANLFKLFGFLIIQNWRYSLKFSIKSFKKLFGFGSKLLTASLYAQILRNIYDVYIGKFYTSTQLGHYGRAIKFTDLISESMNGVIQQVTFPLLSLLKSDETRMISIFRKLIKISAFIISPAMVLLSVLAEPLVLLLLTEKWSAVIPLLKWSAFSRILFPASSLNLNLLTANGRSDLFLKVDLSKLPIYILVMIITLPLGIKEMILGQIFISIISFLHNAYMPGKLFNYGAIKQLKDMSTSFLNSILMGFVVYVVIGLIENLLLKVIIGSITGIIFYVALAFIFKKEEIDDILTSIKRK